MMSNFGVSALLLNSIILFAANPAIAGTVTEFGSDAFNYIPWGLNPIPDLVSASATYDAANLYLSAYVSDAGFPPIEGPKGETIFFFHLDTDQNSATGDSFLNMGSERLVTVVANTTNPIAYLLNDVSNTQLGFYAATNVSNGVLITIPLSALGDDGLLNFRVLETVDLTVSSTTPIIDYLPNHPGLPPGTSSFVPEPASLALFFVGFLGAFQQFRKRRS
jgi:hypothetical protein